LTFEDITLLKPIQFTLPILVQPKKKKTPPPKPATTTEEANNPQQQQTATSSQLSQQEIINQQQQSIFKSMLGEGSLNFYSLIFPQKTFFSKIQLTNDLFFSIAVRMKIPGILIPIFSYKIRKLTI
jgi:hypothetical protein